MTAFFHHLAYDFRTGLRDRSLMLMNYLFPLVFFGMMGLLMTGINPTFKDVLVPAMTVNAIMAGTLLGMPNTMVAAREAGILRSFRINGVPAVSLVNIPMLGTSAHMLLVAGIITALGPLLFGALLPANWLAFVGITLLAIYANAALGMLIGVVAPNSRATVLLAQVLYIPSMMLGGLMLPTSMLPETLRRVAMVLPATHIMNAYNGLAFNLPAVNPGVSVAVLLAGGILASLLSVALFEWDNRLARRRPALLGLLALVPYLLAVVLMG